MNARYWKGRILNKIIKVKYYDHAISLDGCEIPKPVRREVVGYLVEEYDDALVVGFDLPIDGIHGRRMIAIRRSDIISIEVLREDGLDIKPLSDLF